MSSTFDSIKENGEEILWEGKPKFIPFILMGFQNTLFPLLIGIIWLVANFSIKPEDNFGVFKYLWLIGLVPIFIGIYGFINRLFSFSNITYGYSKHRIMIRTGILGTNFKTINLDSISSIKVTSNIIESIFNVGSIRFFNGDYLTSNYNSTIYYDRWSSIENSKEIFKILNQNSVDSKNNIK